MLYLKQIINKKCFIKNIPFNEKMALPLDDTSFNKPKTASNVPQQCDGFLDASRPLLYYLAVDVLRQWQLVVQRFSRFLPTRS